MDVSITYTYSIMSLITEIIEMGAVARRAFRIARSLNLTKMLRKRKHSSGAKYSLVGDRVLVVDGLKTREDSHVAYAAVELKDRGSVSMDSIVSDLHPYFEKMAMSMDLRNYKQFSSLDASGILLKDINDNAPYGLSAGLIISGTYPNMDYHRKEDSEYYDVDPIECESGRKNHLIPKEVIKSADWSMYVNDSEWDA